MTFSLGEIVILLGVGSWAFGPKELPRIAKTLGKLTGRATGFIYKARSNLSQFAEQTEINKVQQELQATMHQLEAIRSELRGGINILDPGPLARRAFGAVQPIGGMGAKQQEQNMQNSPRKPTPPMIAGQGSNTSFAAAGVNDTPPQPPSHPMPAVSTFSASYIDAHQRQQHFQQQQEDNVSSSSVQVIPLSALQAGLVPDRSASTPTGSEVLFDAMQEEKVAHQALAFFQGQENGHDPIRSALPPPKKR